MKKPISPSMALERLETLCARSEQCTYDLKRKLYTWGIPAAQSGEILAQLIDQRYVDDSRFASAYVRDKYRFLAWGRIKIAQALFGKQIPKTIVTHALTEIDESEYEKIALTTLMSKARSIKDLDTYQGRTKLFRAGVARGYEASLIIRLIKENGPWQR